jgi:hypothetical protein
VGAGNTQKFLGDVYEQLIYLEKEFSTLTLKSRMMNGGRIKLTEEIQFTC